MQGNTPSAIRNSTFFRYVLVGSIGFLFELLVLFIALNAFGASTPVAVTFSFWLGLLFSFLFQKLFAFGNRDHRPIALGIQGFAYAALVLVNYGFTLGFAAFTAPVIGVYLARAASLVITTLWNYFAYRYVIFADRTTSGKVAIGAALRRSAALVLSFPASTAALVFATGLIVPLVVLASLANLVADDYSYFVNIDAAGSPLNYAVEHYLTHNGRFAQALLVAIAYSLVGDYAVKIVPVILLTLIIGLFAWVLRTAVPWRSTPWQSSLALSSSAVATALYSMPSFFDTYLWLTSSTVYLGSIVALLLNLVLTIAVIRGPRPRPWLLAIALLLMVLGQTFSEPTALVAIAAWGIGGLWALVKRAWRRFWMLAAMTIALAMGFIGNFLSPGTRSRQTEVPVNLDFPSAVSGAISRYAEVWSSLDRWAVLALLISAALAAANVDRERCDSRWSFTLLVLMLVFAGTTIFVFFVSEVGSDYYPLRNYTLPVFGTVASIAGVLLVGFVRLPRSIGPNRLRLLSACAILACILLVTPFASQRIALQAQALSLRDSAIAQRTAYVMEQLAGGDSEPVLVPAAPVLTRSEAFDIQNPGTEQAEWVIEPFKLRAQIAESRQVEIVATPRSYCLPAAPSVKSEFFCR